MKRKLQRGTGCILLCFLFLFQTPSGILPAGAEELDADLKAMEITATEITESETLGELEKEAEEQPEKYEIMDASYGSAQTWYPRSTGYFMLTVRDDARGRLGRYRIDCTIGERHPNGINYRIYYNMYLIAGDELGITLENKAYYTRHDNATSEIGAREYHLPVTFHLPGIGYHFEGMSTGDCYQTYFESMEEDTCSFVVDTNGCGMTPWSVDGAWHNDNIEVNYLENRYTITYDGNGATSGMVAPQEDVQYGKTIQLQPNQYKKEYEVTFDGNGGTAATGKIKVESSFIGWEDHNSFYDEGIEFPWYAFDAPAYAKNNPDLLQRFGYDKAALIDHFYKYVVHGRERRISSPCFRLTDYMKYGGEDLKQAYGSWREAYLLHWIDHGYKENRTGIGTIGVPPDLEEQAVYEDNAQVSNLSSKHKGSILLKARWKDTVVTFPTAERSGYRLLGWTNSRKDLKKVYAPGETAVITENKTFYALWEKSKPPVIERMISIQNGTDGFITYAYVKDNGDGITKTAFAVWSEYQGQDDLETEWQQTALGEEGDYLIEGQRYNYRYHTLAEKHNYEYGKHLIFVCAYDRLGGYANAEADFSYQFPVFFDGNGGLIDGELVKRENRYYGSKYGTMPEAVKENCYFLGWSTAQEEGELLSDEDIFNHAGELTLYAQWDESPVIEAENQYYSLADAQSGRITEEILLQQACAKDRETVSESNLEGQLADGIDAEKNTIFCVEDYKKEEWQNFSHEGNTTITYYAKDAVGNICRKQVTVYLVDTAPQQSKEKEKQLRFISQEYLNTIPQSSIWQEEENYLQLKKALEKNGILEVWNLNRQKMDEIKEYELQDNTVKTTKIGLFRSKFIQCIVENDEN